MSCFHYFFYFISLWKFKWSGGFFGGEGYIYSRGYVYFFLNVPGATFILKYGWAFCINYSPHIHPFCFLQYFFQYFFLQFYLYSTYWYLIPLLTPIGTILALALGPTEFNLLAPGYGNTGCGVFKGGIKNQKGFWL